MMFDAKSLYLLLGILAAALLMAWGGIELIDTLIGG